MAGTHPENAGINRGSTRSWRRRRPLLRKSGDQSPRLGNPNVTRNSAQQARRTTGNRAGTDLHCSVPPGINRGTGRLPSGHQPMDEAKTPLPNRGNQPDGILVAMTLEPRNERGDQPEFEDEPAPAERPATYAGINPDSRAADPRNHPVTPAPAGSKPNGCRLCRRKITPPRGDQPGYGDNKLWRIARRLPQPRVKIVPKETATP